jgi:hypothetical protein
LDLFVLVLARDDPFAFRLLIDRNDVGFSPHNDGNVRGHFDALSLVQPSHPLVAA